MAQEEKEGGVPRGEREMDAFREAVDLCQFCDLGYRGCPFTWKRGNNPATLVRERLDRFLADVNWCNLFLNYMVRHFAQYRSDHAPIELSTWSSHDRGRKHKHFHFEALWLSKPECGEVVAHAWVNSIGENMDTRIENCAEKLSQWAIGSFGNIKKKIRVTDEDKLKEAQSRDPDAVMLRLCSDLSHELDERHKQEESFWFTRERANDLRDGDKNTTYFHQKASQRKHYNAISGLFDDNNIWRDKEEDLEELVSSYLSTLFSTESTTNLEQALEGLGTPVTEEMNTMLNTEPTSEEIKNALFQMHPNKAPGPDGMHALFFQKFWHIVGNDIIVFVRNWWRGSVGLKEVNKTCVVLISECAHP